MTTSVNLASGRKTNYERLQIGFLLRKEKQKRRQRPEGGRK
jgi:hypothetical protein